MARTVAIGEQDFSEIIQNNYFYTDKTDFIKEWWENGDSVTLITRPRRFGKTMTMSMLYYFFSTTQKCRSDLFENLNIWKEKKYQNLQGTYPVIFLSFAGIKGCTYEETYHDLCRVIAREYRRHIAVLDSGFFLDSDKKQYYRIISGEADVSDLKASVNQLSEYLYHYYGKKIIILLDEYDAPMQEAFLYGYWEDLSVFMRGFLNAAFKTNPYLGRGIMTGITRIGKESIFSDLNHLEVVTSASEKYASTFGFTEKEVWQALEEFGLQDKKEGVKKWYDGFHFGNCTSIYNPWSITQFLDKGKYAPYWANTSSNTLAGNLIRKGSPNVKMIMEDLLSGKSFHTMIDEQIVFDQLEYSESAIWSLLLAGGYLKIVRYELPDAAYDSGDAIHELALTNLEMMYLFQKLIRGWFDTKDASYNDFIKSLLVNDVRA